MEEKEFDMRKYAKQSSEHVSNSLNHDPEKVANCSTTHDPRRCLAFGKIYAGCQKSTHVQKYTRNSTKRHPKRDLKIGREQGMKQRKIMIHWTDNVML